MSAPATPMLRTRTSTLVGGDGPLAIYEAAPAEAAQSAVIIVHEAFGITDHIADVTRRAANAGLQKEIASRGLVFSQFYPDAPPTKQTFPMRNATMSGYGLATIVVEAGEFPGTRIQARVAGQHGRPVILTSRVVRSTNWGRELVGRPGVHVIDSLDELAQVVNDIRTAPERLRNALEALVSG